jgi:RHS repeat-associated protein
VPGGEKVTVTIGELYERVTKPSGVEHHYKIYNGFGVQVAELVRDAPGEVGELFYLHRDHLGTPRVLTDEEGDSIESRSFDRFGDEQGTVDWDATGVRAGFTGHTHDDDVGLVNMKGRLFDPMVGRFISADPFVSNPLSALGWDRYAYVEGNPLTFVDPNGFQSAYPRETGQTGPIAITPTGPVNPHGPSASGANPLGNGTHESNPQGAGANGGSGMGNTNPTGPTHPGGAGNPAGGPSSMGPTSGPPGSGPAMGQPSLSPARSWVDTVQDALDTTSLAMDLSGVGGAFSWIPDLLNAGISASRGDGVGVGLSLGAAIPYVGAWGNLGRLGRSATKASTSVPLPSLKSSRFGIKVADKVPTQGVPGNWSKSDIGDAMDAYSTSIASRKAEMSAFDAVGGGNAAQRLAHAQRITEEESFLRSLSKAFKDR